MHIFVNSVERLNSPVILRHLYMDVIVYCSYWTHKNGHIFGPSSAPVLVLVFVCASLSVFQGVIKLGQLEVWYLTPSLIVWNMVT